MTIAAGQTASASDVNAIKDDVDAILSASTNFVNTSESTSSSSFTNLATAGPAVTVTTGSTALVIVTALISNSSAGGAGHMDFEVTGASSASASINTSLTVESGNAGDQVRASVVRLVTGLTAGSNTFTAKYRVEFGGTATFHRRHLTVIPIGD